MTHLDTLVEKAKNGQLALLLGSDLTQATTGVPANTDLAKTVSDEDTDKPTLAEVTQDLDKFRYLNRLIEEVSTTPGEIEQEKPPDWYRTVVSLPIPYLLSTAYDSRLELVFAMAERPYNLLVDDNDLDKRKFNRTHLVKLRGDVNRRNTLVISRDDYKNLLDDTFRRRLWDEWIGGWLASKTALILGCDPTTKSDFFWLYWDALRKRNAFQQPGYLLWPYELPRNGPSRE